MDLNRAASRQERGKSEGRGDEKRGDEVGEGEVPSEVTRWEKVR